MKKVLIATNLARTVSDLLSNHGYKVIQDAETALETLASYYSDSSILVVRKEKVTQKIIDLLPRLKLIVRAGVGMENIDIDYAQTKNVDVMNTQGANSNAVAEFVLALIFQIYRNVSQFERGKLNTSNFPYYGEELKNKKVGLIGSGRIGEIVIRYLRPITPHIYVCDPVLTSSKAYKLGVRLMPEEDLFETCDIISIHAGFSKRKIGISQLKKIKKNAILINTAWAGAVDMDAVEKIKAQGKNFIYISDFRNEEIESDVTEISTPHIAGSTKESLNEISRRVGQQIINYVEKGINQCVATKKMPDEVKPDYLELMWRLSKLISNVYSKDQIARIECNFYGEIAPFAKWFLPPLLAGLRQEPCPGLQPDEAMNSLENYGIDVRLMQPQKNEAYGNSIALNLLVNVKGVLKFIPMRGIVADGKPVISRIGDFDGLYQELKGNLICCVYEDKIGTISGISSLLAENGINIMSLISPTNEALKKGLIVIRTNRVVSSSLFKKIIQITKPIEAYRASL